MRKTLLYFVILIVLGIGVYYFIFGAKDNPYNNDEAGFTITDTGAIGKLFLAANNNGETILAERTDSGWIVNKKYKALQSTINLIFTTFSKQRALYPVTKAAYDNVIKNMSTEAVKVEVYGRDGKKMKVIYVGGTAVNNVGTNMLIEGAKSPYVVQVPAFNGYLTSRFTTDIKDWRDRTVFDMPANEIKSVSVQYAATPLNSFTVERTNGKLTVKGDPAIMSMDTTNTHRAGLYLGYFSRISCEGYINGLPDNDSTLKNAPLKSTIDLVGMHGQHQHVDVYWMALNKRSKNVTASDNNTPDDYDADRYYAVMNNYKDTVVIQQFVFGKIFRKCIEFYQRDAVAPPKSNPRELPANLMTRPK